MSLRSLDGHSPLVGKFSCWEECKANCRFLPCAFGLEIYDDSRNDPFIMYYSAHLTIRLAFCNVSAPSIHQLVVLFIVFASACAAVFVIDAYSAASHFKMASLLACLGAAYKLIVFSN